MASECDPSVVDGNVGLAFGLVTAAGLSTTIGAATAFVMPYSTSSKNLFLAASLSIAAGVMLYVSFIEIFASKAIADFTACVDERYVLSPSTLFPWPSCCRRLIWVGLSLFCRRFDLY